MRPLHISVVAITTALALLIGLAAYPAPSRLPGEEHGDAELAAALREITGDRGRAVAAAVVTEEGIRTAAIGADQHERFEIASISKTMTGLLLQEAIERGEVTEETRLGELLALGDGELGEATLAELATHTSGAPQKISGFAPFAANALANLTAGNAHPETREELLAGAARTSASAEPGSYSNLGFELLGESLAEVSGTTYPELLEERVLSPLGMTGTTVPVMESELTEEDLPGETSGGRQADPWVGEALAAAGGVRAGISDMALYAQALLEEDLPGQGATEPRQAFGETRTIGWAWITSTDEEGRTLTWHNGQTMGFGSWVGVDRERGIAVAYLSATGKHVDDEPTTLMDRF